jgi:hypothetical protein
MQNSSRSHHPTATREAARFVSDWFDNPPTSSSNRRTEPHQVESELERRKSSTHPIKATRTQAGAGRAMYFGNDVLICERNSERSKPSGENRASKDARFAMKKGASFSEHAGESSVRSAVMLGRSWSELLSTPPGTVIGHVDEQRDSQLAVRACRAAGVETSPRTSKRTSITRTGKSGSPRSANEVPADQNLFMRERELFLKERELFMRERECFLAEKKGFLLEKEQLLRLQRDKTTLRAAPMESVARAVCKRYPSVHLITPFRPGPNTPPAIEVRQPHEVSSPVYAGAARLPCARRAIAARLQL